MIEPALEQLGAEDVGHPPGTPLPFRFVPAERITPLVISLPHVGLAWPADAPRARPAVEFARNADYEVHLLYSRAAALGAAVVRSEYSRLLVDLNRAPDDVSPELVPDHPAPRPDRRGWCGPQARNRGVVWGSAVGNIPILDHPLSYAEFAQRLSRYYLPYHRALSVLLARRRARFGHAILLDAHSMPSSVPGDLILGTYEGGACSPALQQRALAALRASADGRPMLSVRLNDPYRGGELVRSFGRPESGQHALQLEVNRALYMDEARPAVWPELAAFASTAGAAPIRSTRPRLAALIDRVESLVRALASAQTGLGLTSESAAR
ncbi:N-formylglutamate amidohydrolase [Nannocystis radixulma]|uniref:N-formylglutamate amidohydrolase n=1 Tax=Nannocystis radixulma TaxID=2995305 RepID=A0ABT5B7R5_9BACT|nr:N-formylglutamate amidohydrolase [Nannocystis radixulma]MDC0669518.1 N-formylglutamate amidohydrolase [Nannocystis radixulma]